MDLSFSKATLSNHLYPSDFFDYPDLKDTEKKDLLITDSLKEILSESYFDGQISVIKRNGKKAYSVRDIGKKLVLRRLSNVYRITYGIKVKPRNQIVREIKDMLREASGYRLYRLDIKHFFESCDLCDLQRDMETKVPGVSSVIFRNLINSYNKIGGSGLPRGIETSPILSEIILRNFDESINFNEDVYYYCRYVDDIVILTTGLEDKFEFESNLSGMLPDGLEFNKSPDKYRVIDASSNKDSGIDFEFSFIGYKFKVDLDNKRKRSVSVDISSNTEKKIKTKLSIALLDFSRNKDERLLEDRIKFLTTNRKIKNRRSGENIQSGIYYDYPMVDYPSKSLVSLDSFLRFSTAGFKNRISKKVGFYLSFSFSNRIQGYSFLRGHKLRIFTKFSPERIGRICRKWL
ncbi:MAG: antiviral reverse transcriptase Drt3a [Colwellia sp.]